MPFGAHNQCIFEAQILIRVGIILIRVGNILIRVMEIEHKQRTAVIWFPNYLLDVSSCVVEDDVEAVHMN